MATSIINPYITNSNRIVPSLATTGTVSQPLSALETTGTEQTSFANLLADAIGDTISTDAATKLTDLGLITGGDEDLHSITIAGEKADIMLNLTVQIRNRMVEAYQEIMRMQI